MITVLATEVYGARIGDLHGWDYAWIPGAEAVRVAAIGLGLDSRGSKEDNTEDERNDAAGHRRECGGLRRLGTSSDMVHHCSGRRVKKAECSDRGSQSACLGLDEIRPPKMPLTPGSVSGDETAFRSVKKTGPAPRSDPLDE